MPKLMGLEILNFDQSMNFASGEINLTINLAACDDNDLFIPAQIGTPITFDWGVTFYGILDRYIKNQTPQEEYSVYLTSGLNILEGVKLILQDYTGHTNMVDNLMNIYGFLGFTNDNVGENGVYWEAVRDTAVAMTETPAGTDYGGPIKYAGRTYGLDLSELPTIPSDYVINDDSLSIVDFVREVCELAGYEFFFDLVPITAFPAFTGYDGVFVLRTINRTAAVDTISLTNWVNSLDCVVTNNIGMEMRKGVHNKFVLGANVEAMYFNYRQNLSNNDISMGDVSSSDYADDGVLPYFGLDENQNAIIGASIENVPEYYFDINVRDLDIPNLGATYTTSLGEIRAAKGGRESWERFLEENSMNRFLIDKSVDVSNATDFRPFEILFLNSDLTTMGAYDSQTNPGGYLTELLTGYNTGGDPDDYTASGIVKYGFEKSFSNSLKTNTNNKSTTGKKWTALKALNEYPSEASSVDVGSPHDLAESKRLRCISYPSTERLNPYFGRASVLRTYTGWGFTFARLYEWDLADRANPNYDFVAAGTTGFGFVFDKIFADYVKTLSAMGTIQNSFVYTSLQANANIHNTTSIENSFSDRVGQLYARIKDLNENYYNRRFMIQTPSVFTGFDFQTDTFKEDYEPADTGYLDEADWDTFAYKGLIPKSGQVNELTNNKNKFYPFVKFEDAYLVDGSGNVINSRYDLSEISDKEKIVQYTPNKEIVNPDGVEFPDGQTIPFEGTANIVDVWVKCRVLPDLVYDDFSDKANSRVRTVIELPGPAKIASQYDSGSAYGKKALATALINSAGKFGFYDTTALANVPAFIPAGTPANDTLDKAINLLSNKIGVDANIFRDGEDIAYADLYSVPLRSKAISYGPWYNKADGENIYDGVSTTFNLGGPVEYSKDDSLAPWNYGGFTNLDIVGAAVVDTGVTAQNEDGSGTVEFEGSPLFGIGVSPAVGCPHITNINVRFGTNGPTTEYQFQSWSSHNNLNKAEGYVIDRLKKNFTKLSENRRNFRQKIAENRVDKDGSFGASNLGGKYIGSWRDKRKDSGHTSTSVISAETNGLINTVSIQPFYNAQSQGFEDYENIAMVSLDSIFSPYSSVTHNVLPSLNYSSYGCGEFTTSNTLSHIKKSGVQDVAILSKGETLPFDGMAPSALPIETNDDGAPVFRSVGLKTPVVLTGWGFDTHGLPVPNNTSNGGTASAFHNDYLDEINKWKSGPLDVRWNETRGVWTSAPTAVKAVLIEDVFNNTTRADCVFLERQSFDFDGWDPNCFTGTNFEGYSSSFYRNYNYTSFPFDREIFHIKFSNLAYATTGAGISMAILVNGTSDYIEVDPSMSGTALIAAIDGLLDTNGIDKRFIRYQVYKNSVFIDCVNGALKQIEIWGGGAKVNNIQEYPVVDINNNSATESFYSFRNSNNVPNIMSPLPSMPIINAGEIVRVNNGYIETGYDDLIFDVILNEDLKPASKAGNESGDDEFNDVEVGLPSGVEAGILVKDWNGRLVRTDYKISIDHYYENLEVEKNTYGKAEWNPDKCEFELIGVDCPDGTADGSSDSGIDDNDFIREPIPSDDPFPNPF